MFYSQSSIGFRVHTHTHTDPRVFLTRFLHRFSLRDVVVVVVVVVGHSGPPLPSCARKRTHFISFFLSFSRCFCLLHTHFMAPCKPHCLALFHSFIFVFFHRFPLFPRISFSLPLTHARIHSLTHSSVHALTQLECTRRTVCLYRRQSFVFLFSVALGPYHRLFFLLYMTSIYKCKYNILH